VAANARRAASGLNPARGSVVKQSRGFVIALLGAESTGKTMLAQALGAALSTDGKEAAVVPEYLREFCDSHGRTPRRDEQQGIADEQSRRIDAAAREHEFVVADTTALMIAVYSDQVFGDASLYARALASHAHCDLTLLTALDLPWQADGLQRDGPQVREPVDAKVRAALAGSAIDYSVVFGSGDERLRAALDAIRRALALPTAASADEIEGEPRWRWHCERCGDPDCERHRLLPRT
jgi:nicotinamide riboside kinase